MRKLFVIFLASFSLLFATSIQDSEWVRPSKIPIPKNNPQSEEKIALGKKLFFDPILSRANNVSCMSCHNPVKAWADSTGVSTGDLGKTGTRNSPAILNSAYQYSYFWDGRAKSLEDQALGPLHSHVEMNLDPKEAVKKLQKNSLYKEMFEKVFPKVGITPETIAKAIASFERTIVSKNSRFDKYIAGEISQLNTKELKGFDIFANKANCIVCHSGFNFSDQSFNKIGLASNDIGRENVKKRAIWRGTFKTPSLRNIANTVPYFHDGSVTKLQDAIAFCAKGGRDKNTTVANILVDKHLSENEIELIAQFLETLNEPVSDLSH